MKQLCKCCGQPLPSQLRAGVYLPPKKAAIYDYIAATPGASIIGIALACFGDVKKVHVVRQHVYQINCLLAATNVRIFGGGSDRMERGAYRLVQGFQPRPARPRPKPRTPYLQRPRPPS